MFALLSQPASRMPLFGAARGQLQSVCAQGGARRKIRTGELELRHRSRHIVTSPANLPDAVAVANLVQQLVVCRITGH